MRRPSVDCSSIQRFLDTLQGHTKPDWRHLFVTTNWDYLLQREILAMGLTMQPPWLANSHVFHVNGTVEVLPDNSNRSPFLLEEDRVGQRIFTPEANIAYTHMIWQRTFVVVGISFECETDRFLLSALNRVESDLPIGESTWFLVNCNVQSLAVSAERISRALPRAKVKPIPATFEAWLAARFPELQTHGVLGF